MEKTHELAADYFNTFEGRHLYPPVFNRWIFGMVVCATLLAYVFYQSAIRKQDFGFPMVILTFGLMAFFLGLRNYATKQLKNRFGNDLRLARIDRLKELTGRQAHEFLSVAKEITELNELFERLNPPPFRVMRWIYRPDLSSQLVALAVALLALMVTVSPVTFSAPPDYLFSLFAGTSGFWTALASILLMVAVMYIPLIIIAHMRGEVSIWLPQVMAMWTDRARASNARLAYLLRDLLRFHDTQFHGHEIQVSSSPLKSSAQPSVSDGHGEHLAQIPMRAAAHWSHRNAPLLRPKLRVAGAHVSAARRRERRQASLQSGRKAQPPQLRSQ